MTTTPRIPAVLPMSLRGLFVLSGVTPVSGGAVPDVEITALCDDSRAVSPGACFVAVRGQSVDGHGFVESAVRSGATAIVTQHNVPVASGVACVRVSDTREALARLAAGYYGLRGCGPASLRSVGITGTNGKTTVSWLLRSILDAAGESTALIGTVEYDLVSQRYDAPLTTPGSLQLCRDLATARRAGATHAVIEVSSHALDQRRCHGLGFTVGVFTNLSGDHLDYHTTMADYAAAKARLFDLLTPDGVAVVNLDDEWGRKFIKRLRGSVTTFAVDLPDADVTARVIGMDRFGTHVVFKASDFELEVRSKLTGNFNVSNLLAAVASARALGCDVAAMGHGIERVAGVPGRLERVEPEEFPFSVFVDFAHTDVALQNVLRTLRPLTTGRLLCVFGCGGDRDRTKRPRMGAAVAAGADLAFVTSDNPRSEEPRAIIDEILPGFPSGGRCRVAVEVDRLRAIEAAMNEAKPGDTVLIAGKGHEKYQEINGVKMPFDDVQVARQCLRSVRVDERKEVSA